MLSNCSLFLLFIARAVRELTLFWAVGHSEPHTLSCQGTTTQSWTSKKSETFPRYMPIYMC